MPNGSPQISIAGFVERAPAEMEIEVLAGHGGLEERFITSSRIQKLGLALAGFAHYIHAGRLQIVGQSEISYLTQLDPEGLAEALRNLDVEKISCILVTKKLDLPPMLRRLADEHGLPVLRTSLVSSSAITHVAGFLEIELAPQITVHGVLMGMFGIGVLIVGDSGIGKSECALDLVTRGHHLIADDSVLIKRIGSTLEGSAPELVQDFLEIRGLGVINIRELFGVSAIGKGMQIALCVKLKRLDEWQDVDRLGIETQVEEIFGVRLPKFVLPVSPGRNLTTLLETAVRIYLLKESGYDGARELIEKHGLAVGSQR